MINLKNNKGAITLYILICVLFFAIAIVNVHTNLKNKEARVESEYKKIKLSYEKDGGEEYSNFIDNSVYIYKRKIMMSTMIGVIFKGNYNDSMVYIYDTNDILTKNDLNTLKSENKGIGITKVNETEPIKYLPNESTYIYLWIEDNNGKIVSNFIRFEFNTLLEAEIGSNNYGVIVK